MNCVLVLPANNQAMCILCLYFRQFCVTRVGNSKELTMIHIGHPAGDGAYTEGAICRLEANKSICGDEFPSALQKPDGRSRGLYSHHPRSNTWREQIQAVIDRGLIWTTLLTEEVWFKGSYHQMCMFEII